MEAIKISTTQNVDLDYQPAGVGYRLLATLLDGVFIAVYVLLVIFIMGIGASGSINFMDKNRYLMLAILAVLSLPVLLYHFLSETFMNGQSFGKKIVGIKVIKLDGTQPGVGSFMLRSLLRVIDIQLLNGLVALISVAASDKSQRLGDMAAGTTVIKLGHKITIKDTILYNQIQNYRIMFPQVSLLTDSDVAIIKEILEHGMANGRSRNLSLLAKKVKDKMGIATDLHDVNFLQTVLLDYSHYQFEK